MKTAIIIEDEPKAAQELQGILKKLRNDIIVIKTIESIEESVAWLQTNESPDIIFSDIQLSDGISFDIFRKIKNIAPIIFCTAFDAYMQKAFEVNGIGYLLKPLTLSKVEECLRKYDELSTSFSKNRIAYNKQLETLLNYVQPAYQSTLLINLRDKIMPVKVDEVAYLHYNKGVVSVCLFNQQQFFIQDAMDDLEIKLNPSVFYRVNRQFIIQRNSILEIERYFSRKLLVKLTLPVPETIVVSKIKATLFLDWLKSSESSLNR